MKRNIIIAIIVVLILFISTFFTIKYVTDKNERAALDRKLIFNEYQEQEIAKLIEKIDGINKALVSINPLGSSTGKAASVLLYSNEKVSKEKIDKILNLFTKNIDSLDKKNIQIANDNSEILYPYPVE